MESPFKYIYQGKEVSKEEFTNVTKELFKWFDSNTINAVDYSSVSDFLDGEYKSNNEIDKHFRGVLENHEKAENDGSLTAEEKRIWTMLNPVLKVNLKEREYPNLGDYLNKEQKVIEDWNKKEDEQKEEGIGLNIMPNGMPRGEIFTYQPIERKVRVNFYSYDSKNSPIIEVKEFDCLLKAGAYFREAKHTKAFIYKYGTHDLISTWNKEVPTTKKSESIKIEKNGIKETENKVNYGELDWDYIDNMSLRMSKNLDKYPPKNWQKKMEIQELAKSAIRHARKILQEIDNDEETLQQHATALGCNGMMINYQLKNNLK